MNKFITGCMAALALCAASNVYAHKGAAYAPVEQRTGFQDGFYVAGYLGAQWANFNWDGQGDAVAIDGFEENWFYDVYSLEGDDNDTEIVGSVALGYQLVDRRLYLGFEVAGTFDGKSESEASFHNEFFSPGDELFASNTVNAEATLGGSEFDIDLKPGFIINDNFLVYARVGVAFNKLTLNSNGDWFEVNDFDFESEAFDSSSESKNVVGIRLGAGLEYLVTEHLGISLDYLFTDYGTISSSLAGFDDESAAFQHLSFGSNFSEVEVTTQTLMAGLLYHF